MANGFDIFGLTERAMRMDDAAWARHANPKSVYSRFSALPLLTLAIWSRVWLGWWAVAPMALSLVWIWWNPRAFSTPAHTDSWASRGTFGERVFLNRASIPIPAHHQTWARNLSVLTAVGVIPWAYGLWVLNLWAVLMGLIVIIGGKVWFVDRMVWLYLDMKDADPTYAGWSRQRSNVAKTGA